MILGFGRCRHFSDTSCEQFQLIFITRTGFRLFCVYISWYMHAGMSFCEVSGRILDVVLLLAEVELDQEEEDVHRHMDGCPA